MKDEEILKKLDILIRVCATNSIQGKPVKEQVKILCLANLGPKEIAEIVGKTANHVSVILNDLRKEVKNGGK